MQLSERVTQTRLVQRPWGVRVSGMIGGGHGEQGGWQGMREGHGGGQKWPDSGYVIGRPNQGNC